MGEGGGTNVGATSSQGATDAGGMTTSEGGSPDEVSEGGAGGSRVVDLCEGKDITCEDDDDPCTEDECNPATGECGIPRTGTVCDDGKYCNGKDECDAGKCTVHDGNPCTGACNEAGKYCECSTKDDCPADEMGDWGECTYAGECAESTKRSRVVTTYSCNNVGQCVGKPGVEEEDCTRETDGNTCTDDKNPCNGSEKCKAGNCVGDNVDPCKGNPNPYCYSTGTMCRACQDNGAGTDLGCTDMLPNCCSGACQSSTKCFIVVTTKSLTSISSLSTKAAP